MYTLLFYAGLLIERAAAQNPVLKYCAQLHPGCGAGRWFLVIIANRVIQIASDVIGFAAVAAFVWGAITIISAGANEEGRINGRKYIMYALIGVALALWCKVAVIFVEDFLISTMPASSVIPIVP